MATKPQPHFFSVIVRATQLKRLKIPDQFVSSHGNLLPSHVNLQAPSGKLWPVELVKQKGDILLGRGWSEFAAHYSIGILQFVVFQYDMESCFHVIIFNVGATEIEYPNNITTNVEHHDPSVIEVDDDDCYLDSESEENEEDDDSSSVEILEDHPSGSFKKEAHQETLSPLKEDDQSEVRKGEVKRRKVVPIMKNPAAAFKSQNSHFSVTITPSYVRSNYLHIPSSHRRAFYKPQKSEMNVLLHRNNNGEIKTWAVKCDFIRRKGISHPLIFHFGWLDFVRDNNVQVRDVCVFELTDHVAKSYEVSVQRANGNNNDGVSVSKRKSTASRDKLDEHSTHPPLKRRKNERWSVRNRKHQDRKSKSFEISDSDLLKSKSIPEGNRIAKMTTSGRCSKSTSIQKKKNRNCNMRTSSSCMSSIQKKNRIIMKLKNDFKSRNPYFAISMQPSYVSSGNVHIPRSHTTTYLNKMTKDSNVITLCVKETSKRWNVGCTVSQDSSVKLNGGWIRFVVDNGLKVGDACVFELVDVRDKVYRVTIFQGLVS